VRFYAHIVFESLFKRITIFQAVNSMYQGGVKLKLGAVVSVTISVLVVLFFY